MGATILGGTATDRRAIAALHEADMRASAAQDFATLRGLMSDEAVVLAPGRPPLRGAAELDAAFSGQASSAPTHDVLDYAFRWEEVRIVGSHAFEWGLIEGAMRPRGDADAASTRYRYNVMRVLRREPDGEWKVHRTIWNDAPAR